MSTHLVLGPRIVLIASLVVAGCYPITRLNTPTALEPGKTRVALALSGESEGDVPLDFALRHGVVKNVEAGVRLRVMAAEAGVKVQLTDGDVELALAPSAIFAEDIDSDRFMDEYHEAPMWRVKVLAGRGTLLVGTDSSKSVSAWVAPSVDVGRRQVFYNWGNQRHWHPFAAFGLALGAVVGSATARARGLFEVAALFPFAGPREFPFSGETRRGRLSPSDRRLSASVGILF